MSTGQSCSAVSPPHTKILPGARCPAQLLYLGLCPVSWVFIWFSTPPTAIGNKIGSSAVSKGQDRKQFPICPALFIKWVSLLLTFRHQLVNPKEERLFLEQGGSHAQTSRNNDIQIKPHGSQRESWEQQEICQILTQWKALCSGLYAQEKNALERPLDDAKVT